MSNYQRKSVMSTYFKCAAAANPDLVAAHAHNTVSGFRELAASSNESSSGAAIVGSLDRNRQRMAANSLVAADHSERESLHLVNANTKVTGLTLNGGSAWGHSSGVVPLPTTVRRHPIDVLQQSIAQVIEEDFAEHQRKLVQYHTPVAW